MGRRAHNIIQLGSTVLVGGGLGTTFTIVDGTRVYEKNDKDEEPIAVPTEKCSLRSFGTKTKFTCKETTQKLAGWTRWPIFYAVPKDWQCNPQ